MVDRVTDIMIDRQNNRWRQKDRCIDRYRKTDRQINRIIERMIE